MTLWLRVLADLIPLFISAALLALGLHIPQLRRSVWRTGAYLVAVLLFSAGLHVWWVMP